MFITFEGPEGAGKSTILGLVAERLEAEGVQVVKTREPGATEFGQTVRKLLLEGEAMPPESELFLFLADRANHVRKVIQPALQEGHWVLCDRYVDSTFVYQAIVRGLDAEFVSQANQFATGGLLPNRTFLFDLDPEVGLARIQNKDRLDRMPLEFHQSVRAGFLQLASLDSNRWRIVDSDRPISEVLLGVLWELGHD
jgi:dTMP kinase